MNREHPSDSPDRPSPRERFVLRQLDNLVPDSPESTRRIRLRIPAAIEAMERMLRRTRLDGNDAFDPFLSWQYPIFLYLLSREIWDQDADERLSTRVYLLNKYLHGLDLFYRIRMPPTFLLGHAIGQVFVNTTYGDHLVVSHGCTIGRNRDDRPVLEDGVALLPGAAVIGRCLVRANSVVSAGVTLINSDTPGNCLVFSGKSGKPVFKEIAYRYVDDLFAGRDPA
ncbi:MAG TPA: hypothetical protein PKO15_08420 [Fibrobacteria bacterium]|nr:hypothetical protein [Fibrobacteria bacterium]HOX51577.1 hypothetical protein [Fibrobacteria bacterium]